MSKHNIPLHLRKAIWYAYDRRSGYEGQPISFTEMEIDHIIPERVSLNIKEPNEFEKWKTKYNLSDDFSIQSVENLCPSTRLFNLRKSDNGLYDESGAYDGHITRALARAKELKPKIENLKTKFKHQLDKRNTKKIIDVLNLIDKGEIDLKYLISEGLKIKSNDLKELEDRGRYDEILEKYRRLGLKYYNFGEYFEIMSALRYAVSYSRGEAGFWINLFNEFLSNTYDIQVKKKAFYERTYAMFKCGESWEPIEVEILEFFNSMPNEKNLDILRKGALLFGIFCGEFEIGRIKTSGTTLTEIRRKLLENLQMNIDNAITDVRRVDLKYSKFIIESRYSIEEYELIKDGDLETIQKWLDNHFFLINTLISELENISYFDFDEFYNTFIGYSERLPLIKDHPDYDQTFRRISDLKNNYEGIKSIVPELMKRAIELFNQRDYIKAIKQFHKVKNVSFNPNHLYTCINAIYYIGLCYEKLGLLYASKYYFMVVYHMAIETDCEYNTKQLSYALGLDSVALICFDLGSINEMIFYTALSLILRDAFSLTPIDYSNALNKTVIELLQYIILIIIYERKKKNEFIDFLQNLLETFDLWGLIEKPLEKWEQEITKETLLQFEGMYETQFNPSEDERSYSWNQLETKWTIKWKNNYIDTILTEEFIAYLQIYLSTLKDIDIISSNDIEIEIIPSNRFNLQKINGKFDLEIPNEKDSDYFYRLSAIIHTIMEVKMIISRDQIITEIKPLFEEGYFSNYYSEIYKTLIPSDLFYFYNLIHGANNE